MFRRSVVYLVPLMAWLAFAGWLWQGSAAKVAAEKASLRAQGEAILVALESGMGALARIDMGRLEEARAALAELEEQAENEGDDLSWEYQWRLSEARARFEAMSRYRLGRLGQLQASLDELVQSAGVLAVSVVDSQGRTVVSAGDVSRWTAERPTEDHEVWLEGALALTRKVTPRRAQWIRPDVARRSGFGGDGGPYGHHYGRSRDRGGGRGSAGGAKPGPIYSRLILSQGELAAIVAQHRAMALTAGAVGLLAAAVLAAAWHTSIKSREQAAALGLAEAQNQHLREMQLAGAGLAHEIKNPLNVLRGTAQAMLQGEGQTPEQREQLECMLDEIDRMVSRLDEFLSFSRVPTPELAPVRTAQVVEQVAALLQHGAEGAAVAIEVGELPTVQADRGLLRQVVFNLLHNAARAAGESGQVRVAAVADGSSRVTLEVCDSGVGVPEELRDQLFRPYCSGWQGGTGLGLSIVRQIAAAHGWKVGYRPNEDSGSTFWVSHIQVVNDDQPDEHA